MPLEDLRLVLAGEPGTGYAYQLNTLQPHDGLFSQLGSAPNFQGGLITLCSCKHTMRAYRDPDAWLGAWIAGFTSVGRCGFDRHYLLYLMRVSHAFLTHHDLWQWLQKRDAAAAKVADSDVQGDVYRPRAELSDALDWQDYQSPMEGHVHLRDDMWRLDIFDGDVVERLGRVPALLVGDTARTFLWDRPRLYLSGEIARTQKIVIPELLADLREVEA